MALNQLVDSRDVRFALFEALEAEKLTKFEKYSGFDRDMFEDMLTLAESIAVEQIYPTFEEGDKEGCKHNPDTKGVKIPSCYHPALKAFYEAGFGGIDIDAEWGGMGAPQVIAWACNEFFCSANYPLMMYPGLTHGAAELIEAFGTEEQKHTYLEKMYNGQWGGTMCLTEPDAGSDVANLRTTARLDGDEYVISGAKTFITNATRADFLTLAVRTGEPGFGGISFVLFPTDTKGFSVARKLDKLGNRSSDTAELAFDECRIPRRYLLGQQDAGFLYIMKNFEGERLVAAIASAAGAQRTIEQAIEYAKDRKAFGRPLIGFQVTRHKFAEMLTQVAAARELAYHCVDLKNRGKDCTREIAMAKLFCTETAVEISTRCLQVYGGYGYMEEYEIARNFRDTRLLTIGGGASEIMKEIITKLSGM